MKRSLLLIFFALLFLCNIEAQTPRPILVEHFTNTRCGVCANRNPGFYENLSQQPNTLHIAFHPSSPYANCLLHQHNPQENDVRTVFYGILGATPRLVINGNVIPASQNYSSPSLFDPYEDQVSLYDIHVKEERTNDSVHLEITIDGVCDFCPETRGLIAAFYKEDTIFYDAPNGENVHYDVFRRSFNEVTGEEFILPFWLDTLKINYSLAIDSAWNMGQMSALVVVQNPDSKELIQASETDTVIVSSVTTHNFPGHTLTRLPNPVINILSHEALKGHFAIFDAMGRSHMNGIAYNNKIDVSTLLPGLYFIVCNGRKGKFIKI